jgi:hypothetical protein
MRKSLLRLTVIRRSCSFCPRTRGGQLGKEPRTRTNSATSRRGRKRCATDRAGWRALVASPPKGWRGAAWNKCRGTTGPRVSRSRDLQAAARLEPKNVTIRPEMVRPFSRFRASGKLTTCGSTSESRVHSETDSRNSRNSCALDRPEAGEKCAILPETHRSSPLSSETDSHNSRNWCALDRPEAREKCAILPETRGSSSLSSETDSHNSRNSLPLDSPEAREKLRNPSETHRSQMRSWPWAGEPEGGRAALLA